MPYTINKAQFDSVSSLSAEARLKHFISRVADWEELWSLKNSEGWVLLQTPSGNEAAPFWPHPSYATVCAQGLWQNCTPEIIKLQDFLEKWLPGLSNDKILAAVFPTPTASGAIVSPEDLLNWLSEECIECYGDNL